MRLAAIALAGLLLFPSTVLASRSWEQGRFFGRFATGAVIIWLVYALSQNRYPRKRRRGPKRGLVVAALALGVIGCTSQRAEQLDKEGKRAAESREYGKAARAFGAAVELRPDVPEYRYHYGWALGRSGLYDQAIIETREALRLRPLYPEASKLLTHLSESVQERQADYLASQLAP